MIKLSIVKGKYAASLTTAGLEFVRIGFPLKLIREWGFENKDALEISIEGDHILKFKYIGAVKNCPRDSNLFRLTCHGTGASITCSAKKFPALFGYDIPAKTIKLDAVPIDAELCVDISALKKQPKPKGFSVIADEVKEEKPKRKLGFF